ncbi:MAG: hypothetical protein ACON5G_08750 [Pirellulaceae bacterium]|nr:hypothetical protein [Pirellulales bacterium]
MIKLLGRLMQMAGLVILPAAILLQLIFDDPDTNQSELERTGQDVFGFGVDGLLVAMIFGVCVFYLGRMIEGYTSQS